MATRGVPGRVDWILLLAITFLLLFSVAVVYSASAGFAEWRFGSAEALFWNHAVRVVFAVVLMLGVSRIPYRKLLRFSRWMIGGAVIALIGVLLFAPVVKGASRWLTIGPVRFQPSEFAKFALIFYLTFLLTAKQEYVADYRRTLVPLLVWILAVVALIALQPNMSTAVLIAGVAFFLLWLGNVPWYQIGIVLVFLAVLGAGYAVMAAYRLERLVAFWQAMQTGEYPMYQVRQALLAFSNGGLWGVGPGHSVQRALFLPESYGDFVFAIIGEEYGLIGCVVIICLFAVILWRGIRIASQAPDFAGYLLAGGITFAIVLYATVHMGVNLGLLPTTGLPLPFVSYGGTSLLLHAFAAGVLLNVSAFAAVSSDDAR